MLRLRPSGLLQPEEGGGRVVGERKGNRQHAVGGRHPRPGSQIRRHLQREIRPRRRRPQDNHLPASKANRQRRISIGADNVERKSLVIDHTQTVRCFRGEIEQAAGRECAGKQAVGGQRQVGRQAGGTGCERPTVRRCAAKRQSAGRLQRLAVSGIVRAVEQRSRGDLQRIADGQGKLFVGGVHAVGNLDGERKCAATRGSAKDFAG